MRRREELDRINVIPMHEHLEMKVWRGRQPASAHSGDPLADVHTVPALHVCRAKVGVSRYDPARVRELDRQPISKSPADRYDMARRRRHDPRSRQRCEVDASVRPEHLKDRMKPRARKTTRDLAIDWHDHVGRRGKLGGFDGRCGSKREQRVAECERGALFFGETVGRHIGDARVRCHRHP